MFCETSHPIDSDSEHGFVYNHDVLQPPEAVMAAMAVMAAAMAAMAAVMALVSVTQSCRYDHVRKHFGYLKQVLVSNDCTVIWYDIRRSTYLGLDLVYMKLGLIQAVILKTLEGQSDQQPQQVYGCLQSADSK